MRVRGSGGSRPPCLRCYRAPGSAGSGGTGYGRGQSVLPIVLPRKPLPPPPPTFREEDESVKTEYEYIRFQEAQTLPKRKTRRFDCINKRHGGYLGIVGWHASWRQYTYDPELTTYSASCLRDIAAFLEELNSEHKAQRKSAAPEGGEESDG